MKTLISTESGITGLKRCVVRLVFPQGIAIDDYRGRLFIADPNKTGLAAFLEGFLILSGRCEVMYPISSNGDTPHGLYYDI